MVYSLAKLEKKVEKYYDVQGTHDFAHVKRVLRIARDITHTEKQADWQIVAASVLLHDVARKMESEGTCKDHALTGSEMARTILSQLRFPTHKIEAVAYCVKVHRKSKGIRAQTLEAQIVQDADRLEIFGAIGIGRTFMEFAQAKVLHSDTSRKLTSVEDYNTNSIFEMVKSLTYARIAYFNTKRGRTIARERIRFITFFVAQFEKEWR